MAIKELRLWVFSAQILSCTRIVLVSDYTVGGAQQRIGTHIGSPSQKTMILRGAPDFPAWVVDPGVWISIHPVRDADKKHSLDRWSMDAASHPPKVLPTGEALYFRGDSESNATKRLEEELLLGLERLGHKDLNLLRVREKMD